MDPSFKKETLCMSWNNSSNPFPEASASLLIPKESLSNGHTDSHR